MIFDPANVFVVIPAYNEAEALQPLLEELLAHEFQVVLVDDGSIDDTSKVALRYPIFVLRHPCNLGQGAALQTGIQFAIKKTNCRFIVTFDADGQHLVDDIHKLILALLSMGCEVALGSRFKNSIRPRGITLGKLRILKLAILFTRITTRLPVTDTHNGLRAFTQSAARKINLTQNRMAHATEILQQIKAQKMTYTEVPVSIIYTSYSTQKGQSIWNSINILWDSILGGSR